MHLAPFEKKKKKKSITLITHYTHARTHNNGHKTILKLFNIKFLNWMNPRIHQQEVGCALVINYACSHVEKLLPTKN